MKRKLSVLLASLLCMVTLCFAFVGCQKGDVDDVVITVENASQDQTLLSYMQALQEEGTLLFTVSDGMVIKINGTANAGASYWMLYTTDTENANTSWGTYEYNGETLGSAALGVGELVVKNGATYVWTYQTF